MPTMTLDEWDLQYIGITGAGPDELEDFHQQTVEGKQLSLAALRTSMLESGNQAGWNSLLKLLELGVTIAGDVMGLAPVVSFLKGLA